MNEWVEPRSSNLIGSGKLLEEWFVWNRISFVCCLRDGRLITQVSAWKGCWVKNWEPKFCLTICLWTAWLRTKLFENQDLFILRHKMTTTASVPKRDYTTCICECPAVWWAWRWRLAAALSFGQSCPRSRGTRAPCCCHGSGSCGPKHHSLSLCPLSSLLSFLVRWFRLLHFSAQIRQIFIKTL